MARSFVVVLLLVLVGACSPSAPRGGVGFDAACSDVLLVSARGSDAPIGSDEVVAIEASLGSALAGRPGRGLRVEAVELGDLDGDGVLDPGGYPAVAAADAVGLDPAAVAADGDLVLAGGWNDSRRIGSEELVRLLGDRAPVCAEERLVIAGYSMGAAAVAVGLRSVPTDAVDRVDALVLFGDPTLAPGRWLRAPGTRWVQGLLGARHPYVPERLAGRTTSWCGAGDPYCTGNLLLFWLGPLCRSTEGGPPVTAPPLRCERRHTDYPRWAIPRAMADVAGAVGTR